MLYMEMIREAVTQARPLIFSWVPRLEVRPAKRGFTRQLMYVDVRYV